MATTARGPTIDILMGIAGNLVAAGILWGLTRSWLAAVLAVAVVEAVIIFVLLRRLGHARPEIGLEATWRTAGGGPSPTTLVSAARTEFVFWGISGKSMLSDETFRAEMLRQPRAGCTFRFLFLNPTSPHLETKAEDEGDTPIGWRQEIEANVARLKRLRREQNLNVQVRYYDSYPVYRLFFVNEIDLYLGWYPAGSQGIRSPLMLVHRFESSLYHPIRVAFEQAWNSGADALLEPASGGEHG